MCLSMLTLNSQIIFIRKIYNYYHILLSVSYSASFTKFVVIFVLKNNFLFSLKNKKK